ncbi:hypothetical protein ACFQ3W_24105 [Paenibacillus puldeungensis]|uniref:DUF4309 domain-containing protein n=1 Tax=Paenibacillus puldeungensis TaxID=696536 RepID=A0ABW3S4C6_9BACL
MNRSSRNVLAWFMIFVVVLVSSWLFYGPSEDKSGSSSESSKTVKTTATAIATNEEKENASNNTALPEKSPTDSAAKETDQGEVKSPYLLDHLPFKEDEVKVITVKMEGSSKKLPEEGQHSVLQSLRLTDMKAAAAEAAPSGEAAKKAQLHFTLNKNSTSFDLIYNLANNSFEYDGHTYYADDQVLLLMQSLSGEQSEVVTLSTLQERAQAEERKTGNTTAETEGLEASQALVDGLDYESWEKQLAETKSSNDIVWEMPYYDDGMGQVKKARIYKDGVLELNRLIVFTKSNHQTATGVKVGLTKESVKDKLGSKGLKVASRWRYKVGDYYRFHVYFQDEKVKYIAISQPL